MEIIEFSGSEITQVHTYAYVSLHSGSCLSITYCLMPSYRDRWKVNSERMCQQRHLTCNISIF